jgi:two-component system chemotaxis sensor kinase CheA
VENQAEFLLEIEELIEKVFLDLEQLRALDAQPEASGRAGRELLDRLFRHVHSIKGSAASCGLAGVSQIAHEFEHLLAELRAGRVLPDQAIVTTCESATEALSESLRLATSGFVEPTRATLFAQLTAAVRRQTALPLSDATETILRRIPHAIWQASTEPEQQRLRSVVTGGSSLFLVDASFDLANFDEQFFSLKEKLGELGEVISTSPAVDAERPGQVAFRVLYATDVGTREIEAVVRNFPAVQIEVVSDTASGLAEPMEPSDLLAPAAAATRAATTANFVRIDLDKLDQLIFNTNELLGTTAKSLALALADMQLATPVREELQSSSERIRTSFLALADELINLRMVSFGPMLRRAQRAAKQAARLAGKEIDCEILGVELRLDKLIADAIADPLIQLVRNAVDHGIETSDERRVAGKKPRGTIRIEAISEGSQSRLRVVDDGRGIDPQLISDAAQRLGIVPGDSPLDVDRSLRLIFRPGFTTLAAASDLSGRGVGLDIVETAVEQVGGELRVSSKPGAGTTFEIRLPVTFGLLAATVLVSGNNRYCIPTSQIVEIEVLPISEADALSGNTAQSSPDPGKIISMRELLGQARDCELDQASESGSPEQRRGRQSSVLTCEYRTGQAVGDETKRVRLSVAGIAGSEEVLVRNLGRHAGRWHSVAGATELRDGTVALVLDLPRLLGNFE